MFSETIENNATIQAMLQAATQAAQEAIRLRRDAKLNPTLKADNSWFTEADGAAQRIIHEKLSSFPLDAKFIGEEAPPEILEEWLRSGKSGKAWVVDPIDGTFAFKRDNGQPWTVSIALQENGQSTHAVLYEATGDDRDPDHLKGTFYIAQKEKGMRSGKMDGDQLTFSRHAAPQHPDKNLCFGMFAADNVDGKATKGDAHTQIIQHFSNKGFGINHTYCATVGMLATTDGRMAGYAHGLHKPWDSAAATLVMEEAGCRVREVLDELDPQHSIVISSPSQTILTDLGNSLKQIGITTKLAGNQSSRIE